MPLVSLLYVPMMICFSVSSGDGVLKWGSSSLFYGSLSWKKLRIWYSNGHKGPH